MGSEPTREASEERQATIAEESDSEDGRSESEEESDEQENSENDEDQEVRDGNTQKIAHRLIDRLFRELEEEKEEGENLGDRKEGGGGNEDGGDTQYKEGNEGNHDDGEFRQDNEEDRDDAEDAEDSNDNNNVNSGASSSSPVLVEDQVLPELEEEAISDSNSVSSSNSVPETLPPLPKSSSIAGSRGSTSYFVAPYQVSGCQNAIRTKCL